MKTNYSLIFFVLFTKVIFGQYSKNWHGKIISDAPTSEGIYVWNLNNKETTTTQKGGYFFINGTVGDTISLSGFQYKPLKITLTQQNFIKELFFVKMEAVIYLIEPVDVKAYQNITSQSLGILQKPAKEYTLAERRLFTATSGGGFDGLINLLSGRTKMLKKGIEIEKKEIAKDKIESLFDEKYFIETLKIPKEKIAGFEFYCAEDYKFNSVLKNKNKTMAKFLLIDLARTYLLLQNEH